MDAAVLIDASVTLDAAIFPEAGTGTACALAVSAPPDRSFQSSAATIAIGATEIPFPQFECGDPATGDPYWVLVTMAPDEDGTANVGVYASRAWNATGVGGGTCEVALSSDGVPVTVEELMTADAGSIVTVALGNCAFDPTSAVTVTSGWVRAALDAKP